MSKADKRWGVGEILASSDYTIWLAPTAVQQRIRKLVEESYSTRLESRRLLDDAKKMVEKAVLEG